MFKDELDKLLGLEEPKKPSPSEPVHQMTAVPDVPTPEDEFDPESPVDRDAIPQSADPFAALVTEMLKSEGVDFEKEKRRKYNPTSGDLQQHQWESQRERLFSGEPYQFRCKRCLKWAEVNSEETISEVLARNEISLDCSGQVLSDIMSS